MQDRVLSIAGVSTRVATRCLVVGVLAACASEPPPKPLPPPAPAIGDPSAADDTVKPVCGGFEQRELGADRSVLLGGRLTIRPWAGTTQKPLRRQASATATEASTRLLAIEGDRRLTILAEETFVLAEPSLLAAVRSFEAWQDVDIVPRPKVGPFELVRVQHQAPKASPEPVPLQHVFVRSPDRTLQVLTFLANDALIFDGIAGCSELFDQLLETLEVGPVALDLTAGVRKLGEQLSIELPENYAVVSEPGPGFELYRVLPLGPPQQPPAWLGIYVGEKPDRGAPEGARVVQGSLLGKRVRWTEWVLDGITAREVIQRLESGAAVKGSAGPNIHVFLGARESSKLADLVTIAESLHQTP